MVVLEVLPSSSLVKFQISVLFLFLIGYSLTISATPLTLRLALEELEPRGASPSSICLWMTGCQALANASLLALASLPSFPLAAIQLMPVLATIIATALILAVVARQLRG